MTAKSHFFDQHTKGKVMKWTVKVAGLAYGCWAMMAGAVQAQSVPTGLLEKLKSNGCTACHAMDKKSVGPSLKDVAARYKNDKGAEAKLAQKIKMGGSGAWGAIPMPPQKLKEEELKSLASLILQVK